jgi:hypothetical protein
LAEILSLIADVSELHHFDSEKNRAHIQLIGPSGTLTATISSLIAVVGTLAAAKSLLMFAGEAGRHRFKKVDVLRAPCNSAMFSYSNLHTVARLPHSHIGPDAIPPVKICICAICIDLRMPRGSIGSRRPVRLAGAIPGRRPAWPNACAS